MLKIRIIPVLTFNGIALVKTKLFSNPRIVGNPIQSAKVYNSRGVDELVFLDINATLQKRKPNLGLTKLIIDQCFMPVAIGGGITTIEDINDLLRVGADKVVIGPRSIKDLQFISEAVKYFGSQCISISVDIKNVNGQYIVFGDKKILSNLEDFMTALNQCDVGEFLITSIDRDGMMEGYDIDLYEMVNHLTRKPIIAVGGAGCPEHFSALLSKVQLSGLGASSIYHFTRYTPKDVKYELAKYNYPVRI